MYTGPKLTNDDLVFGYDTGYGVADNATSTRFYPGEPTTNLKSANQTSGQILGMQGVSLTYVSEEDGYSKYSMSGTFSAGTYPYCMYLPGVSFTGGTSYSTQCILKTNVPHKFNNIGGGINYVNQPMNSSGTNSSVLQTDGSYLIKRQGFNYVSTTNQSGYIHSNPVNNTTFNSSTDFIYIKNFQIEQNTHCTPWTATSRSNTASLIDLTKSTNLTLSAMTYDSTGQPDYDGTDDYINLGDYAPIRLGTNFTIECVVRPEEDKWMYFFHKGYGSNNSLAWGRHSSSDNWFFSTMIGGSYQNSYMGTATLNKYCHLVATYDGANLRLYENGDLKVTSAKTHDMLTSSASAGIGGPDRYWNGKIPVTKIYSKVLTTEEVVSNFNAYKNRFNI